MNKTVFGWIVVIGLCLGAYIQHTGRSVKGLPKVVQPCVLTVQSVCQRSVVALCASFDSGSKAVRPRVRQAQAACSRGADYVGSKAATLANKLGLGSKQPGEKTKGGGPVATVAPGAARTPRPAKQPQAPLIASQTALTPPESSPTRPNR